MYGGRYFPDPARLKFHADNDATYAADARPGLNFHRRTGEDEEMVRIKILI